MTSRRTLFQSADPAQPVPAMQPAGQPLLDALRALASPTAEGPPARASAISSTALTAPPILTPRLPLLSLYQEGVRPLRDLIASIATGLYVQPSAQANLDKHKLEEQEKARIEDEKRAKSYSAVEGSVIIAG